MMKRISGGIVPRSDSLLNLRNTQMPHISKLNVKNWGTVSLNREKEKYPGGEIPIPSGVHSKELNLLGEQAQELSSFNFQR